MRNIKTSLRFVRNSALLFVAASGVTYLAGCQSEHGLNSGNNEPTPEPSLSTASYSVYGADQNRIRNYGNGLTRGEYVEATETFSMPESVAIPADALDLCEKDEWGGQPNLNHGTPKAGGIYFVKAGDTLDSGLNLTGITVYVAGTLNMGYMNASGENTIYVLPDGKLKFPAAINPGVTVYNYGTLLGNVTVGTDAKVYSAVDISEIEDFGVNDGADFFSKGSIAAKNVRLNGNAVACAFIAEDEITFNGEGTFKASYFKAAKMTLHKGLVVLDNNGLVEADALGISNESTRFTVNGKNAVVYAKAFDTNNKIWAQNTFCEGIACKFDKCSIAGQEIPFNELELQYSSADQVAYVPAAGCHGEFGNPPAGESGEEPGVGTVPGDAPSYDLPILEIKKITDIDHLDPVDNGDHDHGIISATCIQFGEDGTAYASYHLRGNGKDANKNPNYIYEYAQKGCIEVIKDNGEAGMELGSYMIAPDWDFNHLIVDGNRIITVGNAKKMSAFIGTLPVDFAVSVGTDREDFEVRELTTNEPIYGPSKDDPNKEIKIGFKNAGDGNCVVRQGNYYYVATYEGYGPLNLDFSRVNDANGNKIFTKTNGSAKHIAISKNGNMAVLAHDTYDKTSSTASVMTFKASDFSFADQLKKYDAVGTIEPVDGKNVIAMDGDEIYVCLSKGGLVRLSDGKKFQRGTNKQVPVNGMAFDDKYIYVANGSFVSVLDKESMNEICYYHASSKKSANYIALRNGKIYVAFGEDGIQVFQLVEKEIAQN
ncbi:MAG: hypothetical protein K2L22_01600 [Muribaculaceae bacterium]|nr:hypothetical protein [Muribaculaceae bacterium]